MREAIWLAITTRRLCCLCLVLPLEVSILQQTVLSLPGHACTHQPCAASRLVYAAADCVVSERLCSTAVCAVSGHVCTQQPCAASRRVYSAADCAVSGLVCTQQPVLSLDFSVHSSLVLPLDVSILLQTVLSLDLSVHSSLCCLWTFLFTAALCCL
jgi:hypothetical protein